jgi:hypothetical protein
MGTTAISPLMNIPHHVINKTKPITITTTPIMIPSMFDTVITPFEKLF